ncbi:MAG: hypothetical protein HS116_21370 [Planctomycetes bacterium]|nr:hypothetical protein [Planctomycetota bacterium]
MSSPTAQPPAGSSEGGSSGSNANAAPPAKKGMGCWLYVLFLLGFLGLGIVIIAVLFYNSISWVAESMEGEALPPVVTELNPAEQADLWKKVVQYRQCYQEKKDFETYLTFEQFNYFLQHEIDKKKAKGLKEPLAHVYLKPEGDKIRATWSIYQEKEGKYLNLETLGDLQVESRKLSVTLDELKMGGKEAPSLVMWFARNFAQKAQEDQHKNPKAQEAVKLLKREGDKIHIHLDGQHLPPPDDLKPEDLPAEKAGG